MTSMRSIAESSGNIKGRVWMRKCSWRKMRDSTKKYRGYRPDWEKFKERMRRKRNPTRFGILNKDNFMISWAWLLRLSKSDHIFLYQLLIHIQIISPVLIIEIFEDNFDSLAIFHIFFLMAPKEELAALCAVLAAILDEHTTPNTPTTNRSLHVENP